MLSRTTPRMIFDGRPVVYFYSALDSGGRSVRVRGHAKVFCHLMFRILALAADQILRLIR